MTNEKQVSSYLDYLPAIFRQDAFLGCFLLAFEEILSGLEKQLDGIHHYYDPKKTPVEFLEWLSGWVALSLRADLDEQRRRGFIAQAVSLYHLRGTKQGLEESIRIYTRMAPGVNELNTPLQIGVHSTIGIDTLLDGGAPYFFRVTIRLGDPNPEQRRRMTEVATAIIDMEKPAHTRYALVVETPTLQIGIHSTIGVDTLLSPPAS